MIFLLLDVRLLLNRDHHVPLAFVFRYAVLHYHVDIIKQLAP